MNDAKIVRQSRAAKRAYVTGGMGRGDPVPKILVNWLSLYRHKLRLAALVATNFEGPLEICAADLFCVVDLNVSSELAARYVPVYNAKIRAKGLDVRKRWGWKRSALKDACSEGSMGRLPEAFSIIALLQ